MKKFKKINEYHIIAAKIEVIGDSIDRLMTEIKNSGLFEDEKDLVKSLGKIRGDWWNEWDKVCVLGAKEKK